MPILDHEGTAIDYFCEGAGPTVILVHSSVSGNRQWKALTDALSAGFRVIAPNLIGYGETSPWHGTRPQALEDQVAVLAPFIKEAGDDVALVGHSFGATVAMKAAHVFRGQVSRLVLIEPNPFAMLRDHGRDDAFSEAFALRELITQNAARGAWEDAAAGFADYWNGPGSWAAMPPGRKKAFTAALRPNLHEWDAVLADRTHVDALSQIGARTLVISAADTKRPIADIVELMKQGAPHWQFVALPEGGHMVPMMAPDTVNPLVQSWLETETGSPGMA